ncbi:MAG: hypothetical protein AB1589_34440 [Cyanobacteriota bacterium]
MNRPKQQLIAWFVPIVSLLLLTGGIAKSGQLKSHFTPTSKQATKQTAANLPAQTLPVPGWLGFTTVATQSKPRFPWSPSHPNGQIVIFSEDWANVKPGTPLVAVAPGFKQEVNFLRSSQEGYGCDSIPTAMASFSSQTRSPEGPVWILPPTAATNATAIPLTAPSLDSIPTNLLPANQRNKAKAWKAGPATILLQKQGKYKAKLTVAMNNRAIYTQQVEKYDFGNPDLLEPVNFSQVEPGIPQPMGAFQLKAGQPPIIVLWRPGYEGNSFDLLVPEGNTAKRVEVGGMYFCGY